MNRKMSKRQKDIKSKLMAAIAMLLVSSIMMVSTTYAWFTLSTAPEVTGIQTAVGANGNLEMALLNPRLQDNATKALISDWGNAITSGTEDSMEAAGRLLSEANITWGNLVDLQDNNTYGLNNITLYPAALATSEVEGKTVINNAPLSRPVYGADGRMAALKADTLTASYASGTFSNEGAFGVRAIGTASSMTAREMAHRSALNSASNAATNAKSTASATLKTNGNVLAGMAITHVGSADATFTYAQVNTLKTVVTDMQSAHTQIENAMKWYVAAHNIAPNTVTDSTYQGIQDAITGMTLSALKNSADYSKPAGFDTAYEKLVASQRKITTALDALTTALAKGESAAYTWSDVSGALNAIMDYNTMKLNGLSMDKVKETEVNAQGQTVYKNASVIINAMGKEGLQLQMGSGSGVFADVADFCGTYSATIIFPDNTFVMGVGIGGVEATMTTNNPINPTYLASLRSGTAAFSDGGSVAAAKSITDFYGYIVDLGFRTNAAGSNLLLQADAIDRIYGADGKNADVMGHGSSMTFTTADVNFSVPKMQALMTNLRIVFFETDTKAILGEARLDPSTAAIEGNTVTMKMAMWNPTGGDDAKGAFKSGDDARVITALTQNTAKAISVLVYLDGTTVTNADVAATGSQSMVGSMNLQFSSSATLKPMEYADLKDGKSETEGNETVTLTKVKVDNATAALGISVGRAESGTFNDVNGFAVVLNGVGANDTVTAKIAGGSAVPGTAVVVHGVRGYAFPGTVTADTEIEITVTKAGGTQTTTYTVGLADSSAADIVLSDNAANATANTAYTFKLTNNGSATISKVEYSVGGTTKGVLTANEGVYTIPAENVTGNILITVTAQ